MGLAALLWLAPVVVRAGHDTVEVQPHTPPLPAAVTEPPSPPADSGSAGPLPQAEIAPLDITPDWDLKQFDATNFTLAPDAAGLLAYLTKGYSPAAEELSLPAAIALALRYNHDLAQKRWQTEAALAGVDIDWADLRPQLNLQANENISWNNGTGGNSSGGGTGGGGTGSGGSAGSAANGNPIGQLSAQLTQRIYDWGLNSHLIQRDRALGEVQLHIEDAAEQQLVYNVTNDYYAFTAALGQLRIRQDALALSAQFLHAAQLRYGAGTTARLDVIRAEADVEAAKTAVTNAQAALGDSAARFFGLLGVDYKQYVPSVVTADLLDTGAAPPELEDAIGTALTRRPELDMQFATLLAGEAAVKLARNRPLLQSNANALLQDPTPGTAASHNFSLGVQLLWNAYNGGKDRAQRKQARLNVQAISEGLKSLQSSIGVDVATSWDALVSARSNVDSARKNLDLTSEALRAANVGYSAGVTPYLEFQDALNKNIEAALSYLQALVGVKAAQAALDRATGFPSGYPGGVTAAECAKLANDAQVQPPANP